LDLILRQLSLGQHRWNLDAPVFSPAPFVTAGDPFVDEFLAAGAPVFYPSFPAAENTEDAKHLSPQRSDHQTVTQSAPSSGAGLGEVLGCQPGPCDPFISPRVGRAEVKRGGREPSSGAGLGEDLGIQPRSNDPFISPRVGEAAKEATNEMNNNKVPNEEPDALVSENLHVAVETALQDWQEVFAGVKDAVFNGFVDAGWLEDQMFYIAHDVAKAAGGSSTREVASRAEELATEITDRLDHVTAIWDGGLYTEAGRAEVAIILADLDLQFNSFIWNAAASAAAG